VQADHQLRERLAIIPQESFLFGGTVRLNIDPSGKKTDAELNDALSLVQTSTAASKGVREKFHLDTEVHAEGSNFLAGEKQLCECTSREAEQHVAPKGCNGKH
jgi:ABC-type multidrug transport system fused ATPase/permease subunit